MKYLKAMDFFIRESENRSLYLHDAPDSEIKKYWNEELRVHIIPTNNGLIPKIGDKVYIKNMSEESDLIDKKIFTDRVGVIKSYDDELLYRIYNVYFDDLGDYPPQEHQFYSFEFFIIENK